MAKLEIIGGRIGNINTRVTLWDETQTPMVEVRLTVKDDKDFTDL